MKHSAISRFGIVTTLLASSFCSAAMAATPELVKPGVRVIDNSLSAAQRASMETAALRYDTFWNTGDERLALEALADDFVDKTPPPGRQPGPQGALLASRTFRGAVPDLRCEVEQMILAGDRVVVHLHFRGHFTGTFGQTQGAGQPVDFIATDIYQIENGKIAANWHIEDNLSVMKQLGAL
ncbi:ester cyclase [Pseudomonas fluorescens]|jgi:predicted ester cyclase|uniref:ester cyclase n=1 Tax=Pseudomonas fluorescens TaxID=294 RepID=UPI00083CABF9|nr:ester cyclase [Pseudomonas fluorescens]AOE67732.1 ester cyclase [Pseudomonas fluorescens]AOE73546.1 ester cyclase [Pseudomonas fluorescens]